MSAAFGPGGRRVAQLAHRRVATFEYLKRIFVGAGHHMGTIAVPISVLAKTCDTATMRKRAGQLFQLGLSIGKLLRIRDTDEFAKALDALLTEFDVLVGDPQPKRGNLFSRLRTFGEQQPGTDGSLGLLEVAHLPFELDFIEIMITLSDTLVVTYSKLMPARGVDCTEAHLECVQRLDAKIKKHIIHRVIKDIDVVAKGLLREQLQTLVVGEN